MAGDDPPVRLAILTVSLKRFSDQTFDPSASREIDKTGKIPIYFS
jgi:hypothetical protein